VLEHPLDGRAVEQVGAVFGFEGEAVRQVDDAQGEVELRGGAVGLDRLGGQIGEAERSAGAVLDREHHLNERRAALVSGQIELLDEALERDVRMRIGAEGGLAGPPEKLTEGRIVAEVEPEGKDADEEAEETFGPRSVAVGGRRADDHVRPARISAEESGEGGERGHEERAPLAPSQLSRLRGDLRRKRQVAGGSAERRTRGARPVGGEVEHRRHPGELAAPVIQL
jgi:hypothetical protein